MLRPVIRPLVALIVGIALLVIGIQVIRLWVYNPSLSPTARPILQISRTPVKRPIPLTGSPIITPTPHNLFLPAITRSPAATPSHETSLPFPIRLAFYYPWFPEAWNQQHLNPFTNFHPLAGWYDSSSKTMIEQHIKDMQYANIQAGIASWWGQGTPTDQRIQALLDYADQAGFYWALYYEAEGSGNPSIEQIRSDLTYIRDQYTSSRAFLKIDGRFVIFVYGDPGDNCDTADRWKQANTVGAYVVLKVFPGYAKCPAQPDAWHQYAPANDYDQQGMDSVTISPGFWKAGESTRLDRDISRWYTDIQTMVRSQAHFQLITTFNEWGEGTAVEAAAEWVSASGFGEYLDGLHTNGQEAQSAP